MTKSYLTSVSSMQTKYPKKLLLWNYWDHEHIVGTHFAHYKKVKILFEKCHAKAGFRGKNFHFSKLCF